MTHETIGLLAAFLTTSAFLPQVIKAWKTRSVEDISLLMYVLFTAGIALWLCYGIVIKNRPIIIANASTLTFAISILYLKICETYKKKN